MNRQQSRQTLHSSGVVYWLVEGRLVVQNIPAFICTWVLWDRGRADRLIDLLKAHRWAGIRRVERHETPTGPCGE